MRDSSLLFSHHLSVHRLVTSFSSIPSTELIPVPVKEFWEFRTKISKESVTQSPLFLVVSSCLGWKDQRRPTGEPMPGNRSSRQGLSHTYPFPFSQQSELTTSFPAPPAQLSGWGPSSILISAPPFSGASPAVGCLTQGPARQVRHDATCQECTRNCGALFLEKKKVFIVIKYT